jgi:hypothetical protein
MKTTLPSSERPCFAMNLPPLSERRRLKSRTRTRYSFLTERATAR